MKDNLREVEAVLEEWSSEPLLDRKAKPVSVLIHMTIHPSIHPSIHITIHPSIHTHHHPSIHPSINLR